MLLAQLLAGIDLPGLPLDEAVLDPDAVLDRTGALDALLETRLLNSLHLALGPGALLDPLLLEYLPLGTSALLELRASLLHLLRALLELRPLGPSLLHLLRGRLLAAAALGLRRRLRRLRLVGGRVARACRRARPGPER